MRLKHSTPEEDAAFRIKFIAAMHSKQKSKPCGRHGMTGALMDRIKAHRSAPDVYDPPTLDQMANRIEELEASLAEQVEWVRRLADDLIVAEAKLAKAVRERDEALNQLFIAQGSRTESKER